MEVVIKSYRSQMSRKAIPNIGCLAILKLSGSLIKNRNNSNIEHEKILK